MKININGQDQEFADGDKISYEQIAVYAGYAPESVVTVVYARGDTCGNLTFGQAISAREGLKISAMRTGNA